MIGSSSVLWQLVEYLAFSGEGVITKWQRKCKKFDAYAEFELDAILSNLVVLKKELWDMPEYRVMTNMDDLGEIRFQNKDKKQLRIFGFFRDEERRFVMVAGAVKEGKKDYEPNDVLKTAISRRDDILKGYADVITFAPDAEDENE